ncbi:MAG: ABC transporter ATP-binding protein [Lachnospiraceae bacterium]|nr:ABC transporter ATP-binding protein [Lachnospiraceae bacterium]
MKTADKELFFYTEQLTVGYDGKPLIRNIRIQAERGEILVLIGPNGAGKSTILKSIARQLKILGGGMYLDSRDLVSMNAKEAARKQAVMLTERIRTEFMTCRDVVSAGRYPYTGALGMLGDEDREKVNGAMALVETLDLADRDFSAISDGQRQRVLLARAICQEPELIILDEPTSFLDISHKVRFLMLLKQLARERNVTVIMSLHELDLASKIADTIICVKGEYIDRYGSPGEIFAGDYIRGLFSMEEGNYNAAFGCAELPPPEGLPEVFVIAGGGSGIPVYRMLQRKGIPFATGILLKNDIDHEAAAFLCRHIAAEEMFEPVSEKTFLKARELMLSCETVIAARRSFGPLGRYNEMLIREASERGKLTDLQTIP